VKLSVAYTFEPGIISRLGRFPEVKEIYGKLDRDVMGGGRSPYTLRPASHAVLCGAIAEAHQHSMAFNYLLNAALLDGSEQTRNGQRTLRYFVAWLDGLGVDAVTVASPLLLAIVKREHPGMQVRVGAFAGIDTPEKARQWEDLGADTLCLSAIACNRDMKALAAIRKTVKCELQLIVNASCLPFCAHELTHMNLLTQSSRKGHHLGGYCLDYCFLNCSRERLSAPEQLLRAIWIRPEDLHHYQTIGYSTFKIVERSCPGDLLVKRVEAYVNRSFNGNLMELVAPVAQIKKSLKPTTRQYARMLLTLAKPWHVKMSRMLLMKKYAEAVMLDDFSLEKAPVYIDNKKLDGFFEGITENGCRLKDCTTCNYCRSWAEKTVKINEGYREKVLSMGKELQDGLADGSHWF
jgi:collagenase-like PrtC family protease